MPLFKLFNLNLIANKFRLSYLIFALILCATFIGIFSLAEEKVEEVLVESFLLQQLQLNEDGIYQNISSNGFQSSPDVTIYTQANAPKSIKSIATEDIQEISIKTQTDEDALLYFIKYPYHGQIYILTYLDKGGFNHALKKAKSEKNESLYPVFSLFEQLEGILYSALIGAIVMSLLVALIFSYFSTRTIIKPLSDLREAVESDQQDLTQLANLPSEVGVLARTIENKNNKLAQYLKREQLFTGDVSHELRTPLTIIMGASEVLISKCEHLPCNVTDLDNHLENYQNINRDMREIREFSQRIYNTAKDSSDIISALLLLSRAPELLDRLETSINNIAHNEVARLGYLLKHKPVTCVINADKDYTACVRPELLKMALGNLIKNAFQYTEKGEVVIRINSKSITVSDTGLGIPDTMMPLVYERFERNEHTSVKVEGTGLGLSIVQRIMTHLGWHLSHISNKDGGTTFTIFYY